MYVWSDKSQWKVFFFLCITTLSSSDRWCIRYISFQWIINYSAICVYNIRISSVYYRISSYTALKSFNSSSCMSTLLLVFTYIMLNIYSPLKNIIHHGYPFRICPRWMGVLSFWLASPNITFRFKILIQKLSLLDISKYLVVYTVKLDIVSWGLQQSFENDYQMSRKKKRSKQ